MATDKIYIETLNVINDTNSKFFETLFCDKNYFSLRKHCVAGFFFFFRLL